VCTTHEFKQCKGFTLIEVMLAVLVVGIVPAAAVNGISGLASKGGLTGCAASAHAASAAAGVHFAKTGAYPTTLDAMTSAEPKELELPSGVVPNRAGTATIGASWTLTMSTGDRAMPAFTCS
jgi:prepilin-type N-terminal cleavage/methylation domain-containing protein